MSNVESETKYEPFSNKRMMAFSLGGIIILTMIDIRGWVQLYMTWGLKLSIYMVLLVFLIYAMWDAVNDPLTGYLLDRSKKFTSKYGKRFPLAADILRDNPQRAKYGSYFVLLGGIPAAIMLIAALFFIKFNKITKEVALENKKKLIAMGL